MFSLATTDNNGITLCRTFETLEQAMYRATRTNCIAFKVILNVTSQTIHSWKKVA